jgi:glyoxylase-like metal-dependent hydrolase (beta-lactamase superfamily II)
MPDFEPAYLTRPGAGAMLPAVPDEVEEVSPGIWCSPGLSNVFMIPTSQGRVIINAGMGFEGPVHRANLDSVDSSPVRYVILTQGHYDHVGGLDSVRDPD